MQPSCEPLHSWDRGRSNTLAMSQRFVHKEFRHPFFLHSAASAITSPSPQSVFPRSIPNKGAQVLVTSAISAPGEGHSRVGRKNLPRIRSSVMRSPAIVFWDVVRVALAQGRSFLLLWY